MSTILVTGAAGYIGSHTCVELLAAGFDVVAVDDFSNSCSAALERVVSLAGKNFAGVYAVDVRDRKALGDIFSWCQIDAVIHFAAKKAVGESVRIPLEYYDNNLGSLISLLSVMAAFNVRKLVFSSSATVYGDPASVPIREDFPTAVTNPYGRTKLIGEEMLRDLAASDPDWRIALLRYFNPVGAHPSGQIGEDPSGVPNNLLPYVSQVAVGLLAELKVFGGDYPTADGTGVRDYIHVVDLAVGHVRAVERLAELEAISAINLGTGQGYSVLEVIRAFEVASGRPVPFRIVDRRPGDIAACWADPEQAGLTLGWRAERNLQAMCEDAWRWQSNNPRGYSGG